MPFTRSPPTKIEITQSVYSATHGPHFSDNRNDRNLAYNFTQIVSGPDSFWAEFLNAIRKAQGRV